MPMYEYHCNPCNKTFEKRVKLSERAADQVCPVCGGAAHRVEMSRVAISRGGSDFGADFGGCGGGACEMPSAAMGGCCGGGACVH